MPTMTAKVSGRDLNVVGRSINALARRVIAGEQAAARQAAEVATAATRDAVRHRRPDNAGPRRGRKHEADSLRQALRWVPKQGSGVQFDRSYADEHAKYWIVQEIGTGKRATMRTAGSTNPTGRPKNDASYIRTVRSQIGRAIPFSLAWGTGPGGSYTAPGAATGQQLYLRRKLKGAPLGMSYESRQMHISREIEGQHFVKKGGKQGFRDYRQSVLAVARRQFAGHGKARP